ncbi:uncharacterized protein LOC133176921 [Saccostrea echinata]|uniref:uncharacterized protein LOC133176921 n=1 Tax=Saccostrea echinata TaxID=191078 RepID=UPI002A839DB1|nr:uncharacterized protein LOC133176921 [Saccostrea echinata]
MASSVKQKVKVPPSKHKDTEANPVTNSSGKDNAMVGFQEHIGPKQNDNRESKSQNSSTTSVKQSSTVSNGKTGRNHKILNGSANFDQGLIPWNSPRSKGNSPRGKIGTQHHGYAFGSKTGPSSSETIELPFLKDSLYTDTILVVEGKKFYIHRSLLGYASEHFQKLFAVAHAANAAGDRKTKPEIVIKDKTYNDFVELLAFFHPGVVRELTDKTAVRLLPIADEYEMRPLKKRCENVLVNHLKKNSSLFNSATKGPPTQRFRRDNAPEILLKCTKAADKGHSKAVLEECLKVFANPDIPLKDLKNSTDISDQIKAKIFETRVDTTSTKLTKVVGALEKEMHENNLLKKQLNDRYNVQKPGLRMSINSSVEEAHPIPSSVPVLHAHHYHTHHRHNIATGKDLHKPPPSTKRNSKKQ